MKIIVALIMGCVLLTGCASSSLADDAVLRQQTQKETDTLAIAPYVAQRDYEEGRQDIVDQKAAQKAAGH